MILLDFSVAFIMNKNNQLLEIKERYVFQNKPTKFANIARNWIGTIIILTRVATGHIYQFVIKACFILFFISLIPFLAPEIVKSLKKDTETKNPHRNAGAKII